jgi:catechol 2,3-dioxygenase-like lactoylglutathione lyase family enzyme
MGARLTEIVVDCHDPELMAAFWCAVLGWEVVDRDGGSVEIQGRTDGPTLLFDSAPDDKVVKNRIHLDVNPTDGDRDAEVERLLGLGARHVDIGQHDDPDTDWVVLTDPEGNEFCVLDGQVDPEPPNR